MKLNQIWQNDTASSFLFIEENVNFVHQEDVTFSMKVIQLLVCVTVKANVDQYCLTF